MFSRFAILRLVFQGKIQLGGFLRDFLGESFGKRGFKSPMPVAVTLKGSIPCSTSQRKTLTARSADNSQLFLNLAPSGMALSSVYPLMLTVISRLDSMTSRTVFSCSSASGLSSSEPGAKRRLSPMVRVIVPSSRTAPTSPSTFFLDK